MSEWKPIETALNDPHCESIDIWNGDTRYTDCVWETPQSSDGNNPCWCYAVYERNYGLVFHAVPHPTYWMSPPDPPEDKP